MNQRVVTWVLVVGLGFSFFMLFGKVGAFRLPGNQQGYEPVQPIAYSHRLHAGELQIACLYCHSGAELSRHAGIPSANICMNCHKFVTATLGAMHAEDDVAQQEKRPPRRLVSLELQKLYDALGLNENLERDPAKEQKPVAWVRIHKLPDFAYFDHRAHVGVGVECQQCHGQVTTMERMRQAEDLSMGWCVNCHRDVNRTGVAGKPVQASIDCQTCHY